MKIEEARRNIDAIDREIVALLDRRGRLAQAIGAEKLRIGLAINDETREREILNRVGAHADHSIRRETMLEIFRVILRESRWLQAQVRDQAAVERVGR
jgi:chorismate mutase